MDSYIRDVVSEFHNVPIAKAVVHTSTSLSILADLLLERGILLPCKRRRQGIRGRRSARNHMLRKALWYARYSMQGHK